jgi:hypothetical protein
MGARSNIAVGIFFNNNLKLGHQKFKTNKDSPFSILFSLSLNLRFHMHKGKNHRKHFYSVGYLKLSSHMQHNKIFKTPDMKLLSFIPVNSYGLCFPEA